MTVTAWTIALTGAPYPDDLRALLRVPAVGRHRGRSGCVEACRRLDWRVERIAGDCSLHVVTTHDLRPDEMAGAGSWGASLRRDPFGRQVTDATGRSDAVVETTDAHDLGEPFGDVIDCSEPDHLGFRVAGWPGIPVPDVDDGQGWLVVAVLTLRERSPEAIVAAAAEHVAHDPRHPWAGCHLPPWTSTAIRWLAAADCPTREIVRVTGVQERTVRKHVRGLSPTDVRGIGWTLGGRS